tara:strand:- start:24 stop:983 length:960 start_codon:yes stop_codon:yes gene_type:complete
MNNDKNIGFIGLGNLGSKLANSILISKYNLFLYDLDKKKAQNLIKNGGKWCKDLKTLCLNTSIIITCLPSPEAVSEVIENNKGLSKFTNKSHLWIEMSTTDENEIIRLSKIMKKIGTEILEAPVTGGQHRAVSGNISVLTAGKRKNFVRALPILSELGYQILYCGKLGNASTLKIVTNYLASINLLSLGEALMVCKKYNVDLKTAFHAIKISSGNSFVHETESQVILNGSYDVGFTMDLVCKDVGLFDKLTDKLNIPADISKLMNKIFKEGLKKYGRRSFSTSIVKRLEEKCNEELRASNFPSKLIDKEKRMKGFEIKF